MTERKTEKKRTHQTEVGFIARWLSLFARSSLKQSPDKVSFPLPFHSFLIFCGILHSAKVMSSRVHCLAGIMGQAQALSLVGSTCVWQNTPLCLGHNFYVHSSLMFGQTSPFSISENSKNIQQSLLIYLWTLALYLFFPLCLYFCFQLCAQFEDYYSQMQICHARFFISI